MSKKTSVNQATDQCSIDDPGQMKFCCVIPCILWDHFGGINMAFWKLILTSMIICCFTDVYGDLITDEMRLFDNISSRANPYIRPVYNFKNTVRVNFGLALLSILDLDESSEMLTVQVWERLLWKDPHIAWNPEDFGGVDHIRIPINKIWQPDFRLFNEKAEGRVRYDDVLAVVSSDGAVLYILPAVLQSACTADMTYFPYDKQTCNLKFGSWTWDGFKIDPDFYDGLQEVDIKDYTENKEFILEGHPAQKNVKYYPCCEESYPDLTFTLQLRRRGGLQSLTFVAPIFVLALLCPIIFLMPYSDNQRFSLGGSLLICLAIILSSFENIFPSAHGSTPLLAQYYISVVVLLVLSLIISTLITNIADRASRPGGLPKIVKKVFLDGLGKVLCVSSENYNLMNEEEGSTSQDNSTQWKSLAQVLDRLLFIIYVILTVVLTFVFLFRV